MSSILTNTSAMVALQTLRGINKNLAQTQGEISTGKSVANARDNAAVWAISKTMESDVRGFKNISDSLALGQSSVGVARQAAETVTDLLTQMKGRIVAAQEENVDRSKIQTDIVQLREQIVSVVNAAQFNGLNLVNGSSAEDVNILSSLDRDSNGMVSASSITFERRDLSLSNTTTPAAFGGTAGAADTAMIDNGGTNAGTAATLANAATQNIDIASVGDGFSYRLVLDDSGAANSIGQRTFEYVAGANDSMVEVAANLANQMNTFLSATGDTNYTVARDGAQIQITNNSGGAIDITAQTATGGTAGVSAGGLGALNNFDVTTEPGATSALTSIETLIQTSIDAAAAFGSAQARIDTQSDFVKNLTDALTTGIGSLVDADMEAASARLQALQVQQQLATQSLSIANQEPQNILSLFR